MSLPYSTSQAEAEEPITISSDRIVAVIQGFIQEERKRSFSFLGRYSHRHENQELLVVKPASPDDVASLKQTAANLESAIWLSFIEPKDHRTVAIRALDKEDVKIESMLIGEDPDSICDAATWLRKKYCLDYDTPARYSALEDEEQAWWWATTGKSFRLLHLPLELRKIIYLHVIGPVCVPDVVTVGGQEMLVLGVGQQFLNRSQAGKNCDPDIPCPNLSIFRVNKQVRTEVTIVANHEVVMRITTLRSDPKRGPRSSPSTRRRANSTLAQNPLHRTSFLRRIQFEMPAKHYFVSIGIRPMQGEPLATCDPGSLDLKNLFRFNGLKELDLRFISPKHMRSSCPWANRRRGHSCQKKWIDLFLTLAWDLLHGLHVQKRVKLSLSGCIKNSTRKYWGVKLNSSSVDDVPLVKEKERSFRSRIQTYGINDVLRCQCTNPCVVNLKAGEDCAYADNDELRRSDGWQDMADTAYWDYED